MNIPGAKLIHSFLHVQNHLYITQKFVALQASIALAAKEVAATRISTDHNLASTERYKQIVLRDEMPNCHAQFFEAYGDPEHELTYFNFGGSSTNNVPQFIVSHLMPCVQTLLTKPAKDWRCTFNVYKNVNADFDFHIDRAFNGNISAIYTVFGSATCDMRLPGTNKSASCFLEPNSLLLLSKEARWHWQHRIVSQSRRMSIVLGIDY